MTSIVFMSVSFIHCDSQHYYKDFSDSISILVFSGICTWCCYWRQKNSEKHSGRKYLTMLGAMLIAGILSISKNYYCNFSWAHCFGSSKTLFLLLSQTGIWGYAIYQLLFLVLHYLDSWEITKIRGKISYRKLFIGLIALRILFLIAFFPGIFDFDAALGMRTFLSHESVICNHHPVFVQAVHALFFQIGDFFGCRSLGFAILSILFIICSTSIILYGVKLIEMTGVNHFWLKGIAIVFTFLPIFPYLSITITKDGFFAYTLLLYVFTIYEIFLSEAICMKSSRFVILHSLAILLVCFTRNQGIIIAIIESICLLVCYHKYYKQVLLVTVPGLLSVFLITRFAFPYWGIEAGGKQEVFGTLFQQTSYYLTEYPEDITIEEEYAINAILNKEDLINNYSCYITDPIKNDYQYNPRFIEEASGLRSFRHIDRAKENEQLNAYLQAWWCMGLRHPSLYVEASAAIFLGFFYNIGFPLLDIYTPGAEHPSATSQQYKFWRFNTIADYYYQNRKSTAQIPVFNWVLSIPYYIWASIILLFTLVRRKDFRGLTLFLPVILSIGILLICPVVSGRYAVPIVVLLPLLLFYVVRTNHKNSPIPAK